MGAVQKQMFLMSVKLIITPQIVEILKMTIAGNVFDFFLLIPDHNTQ